ncbi:hypothetical protein Peur_060967 [Populus x canadensis]
MHVAKTKDYFTPRTTLAAPINDSIHFRSLLDIKKREDTHTWPPADQGPPRTVASPP